MKKKKMKCHSNVLVTKRNIGNTLQVFEICILKIFEKNTKHTFLIYFSYISTYL